MSHLETVDDDLNDLLKMVYSHRQQLTRPYPELVAVDRCLVRAMIYVLEAILEMSKLDDDIWE